jgi:hypothetical protein
VKKTMAGLVAGAALMALTAGPAAAQTTEIGGGFVIQKWDECCQYGFAADVAQAIKASPKSSIAIVGDFGWARMSGVETDMSYTGGVRFTFLRDKRVAVFAHGTAGLMQSRIDAVSIYPSYVYNDFLVGGGGGAKVRLTTAMDVKAQIDLWGDYYADVQEWHPVTRFLVAAVFKFGRQ